MRAQKREDTVPEKQLRSALHALGLRFRIHAAPLVGIRRKADIVFPRARLAVFVDGCFWHGCLRHGTLPRANAAWWRDKLAANRARDRQTDRTLRAAGWVVIRAWEHQPPTSVARRVLRNVRRRQQEIAAGKSQRGGPPG